MRTRASITTLSLITAIAAGLMLLSVTCGGKSSSTGTKTGGDGRIFLQNGTSEATVFAKYYNEDLMKEIETEVPPGQKKEVSQAIIKQGTKVKFTLSGKTPYGYLLSQDIEVEVAGNITIHVKTYNPYITGQPFEYTIIKE